MKIKVTTLEVMLNIECKRIQYSAKYNTVTITGIKNKINTDFTTDVIHDSSSGITVENVQFLIIEE